MSLKQTRWTVNKGLKKSSVIRVGYYSMDDLETHLDSLKGLGAAYRIGGYVILDGKSLRFTGIVFGGHYGGHNVNIKFTKAAKTDLSKMAFSKEKILQLEAEIQRRILQGEMVVHYDKLKPDVPADLLGAR